MKGRPYLHRLVLSGLAVIVFYATCRVFYTGWWDFAGSGSGVFIIVTAVSSIFWLWIEKICGRQDIVAAQEVIGASPYRNAAFSDKETHITVGRGKISSGLFWTCMRAGRETLARRNCEYFTFLVALLLIDVVSVGGWRRAPALAEAMTVSELILLFVAICHVCFMTPFMYLRYHRDWVFDEVPWLKRCCIGSLLVVFCFCLPGAFKYIEITLQTMSPDIIAKILLAMTFPAFYLGFFLRLICILKWGERTYPICRAYGDIKSKGIVS